MNRPASHDDVSRGAVGARTRLVVLHPSREACHDDSRVSRCHVYVVLGGFSCKPRVMLT
jgi:hypothetical protein